MYIVEVKTPQEEKAFFNLPLSIYKDNPYWIRPLVKDEKSVFDPKKNTLAKPDAFRRWLLKEDSGKVIGRIAAFINPKTVHKNNDYPVGGMGFFECINNQDAANILFDIAKDFLEFNEMEAMEGPINFGDRDKFWGLLTKGFEEEPNYLANYHQSYYKELFENYGFKTYFNQFTFKRLISLDLHEENIRKAKEVLNNKDFEFRHIKIKDLDTFTEDFRIIYNKAWVRHIGVSEMTSLKAKAIIKSLKPVLDEKAAWFGYYKGEPIAFFVTIPEVNQIFKHINGHLNIWGKLVFLYHKIRKKNKKLLGILFGVIPEFDGKSVTKAITYVAQKEFVNSREYKFFEMHGIGDFNPAMIKFVHKLGHIEESKIHTTYRYLFDQNMPYERMPIKKNRRGKK